MIITELQQLYATHPNVEGMCKLLKDNSVRHLYCSGLCASAASLFSSVLVQQAECPFVFILGDLEEAGYFYHDLTQILGTGQVLFFPSSFPDFPSVFKIWMVRVRVPFLPKKAVKVPLSRLTLTTWPRPKFLCSIISPGYSRIPSALVCSSFCSGSIRRDRKREGTAGVLAEKLA